MLTGNDQGVRQLTIKGVAVPSVDRYAQRVRGRVRVADGVFVRIHHVNNGEEVLVVGLAVLGFAQVEGACPRSVGGW